MPRLSLSELGSSQPLELEHLEPRELLSGNPIVAQVREMTWETLSAATTNGYLYRSDTDGTWVVGAYQNGTVEVRSAETGAVERTLQTGVGRAYAVTVDNGIAYVSAGTNAGGCVIAWDCATGAKLWQKNLGNNANAIGIEDGVIGVDVDYKGTMQIDAASGNVLAGGDPEGYYGTVVTKGVVVYARAGNQVWLDDNGSRRMLASGGGNITARIAVSPDGQFIAVGRSNGGVELRSVSDWNVVGTAGVNGSVSSIGWSVTGKTLLVGSASGEVSEWTVGEDGTLTEAGRTDTGRMVFAVDEVNGAVFAQAGDSAAVWRELPLWEVRVAEVVAEEEPVEEIISDEVYEAFVVERDFSVLSAYAAGQVLSARSAAESMRLAAEANLAIVTTAQAGLESAATLQEQRKQEYLAAESALGAAVTARKAAENNYWATYNEYKYTDAGKIAQAQNAWNSAIAAEQQAIVKKTTAAAVYLAAQEACTDAQHTLDAALEDYESADAAACNEENACRSLELKAFAGELVAPTEHELWVAARQEEVRGKLTAYGYDQWNAAFAANGYETAPPIWKTGSISFGLSMQQLPESIFNATACKIDKEALILSIARGHESWLFGATYAETWAMTDSIAAARGMSRDAVWHLQLAALEGANEEAHELITAFQTMVSNMFMAELTRRTGGDVRDAGTVSHPLLPSKAAIASCILERFDILYANYSWMCRQSDEGHTITAGASTSDGPNQTDDHSLAHAHNMKVIMSSAGTTSTSERLYTYIKAYPEARGVLIAMSTAGEVDDGVITNVQLVAAAQISDGSVLIGETIVEEQQLHFGEEIESALANYSAGWISRFADIVNSKRAAVPAMQTTFEWVDSKTIEITATKSYGELAYEEIAKIPSEFFEVNNKTLGALHGQINGMITDLNEWLPTITDDDLAHANMTKDDIKGIIAFLQLLDDTIPRTTEGVIFAAALGELLAVAPALLRPVAGKIDELIGTRISTTASQRISKIEISIDEIRTVQTATDDMYSFVTKELIQGKILSKHAGKTDQELMQLFATGTDSGVSSFANEQVAVRSVNRFIEAYSSEIQAWLAAGENVPFAKNLDMSEIIGRGVYDSAVGVGDLSFIRVVLVPSNSPTGFSLVSAYPILP